MTGMQSALYPTDVKAIRINQYQFGQDYMKKYHSHLPISASENDQKAQLALYSLRRYSLLKSDECCEACSGVS